MKKLITLLALSIVTVYSFGQITISNADMPAVNDTFRLSITLDAQGLDPLLTGTNFSWDFSTLVPDSQRVDTFYTVSSTPFGYQIFFNNIFLHPNYVANYAINGPEINIPQSPVTVTEVINYIKNSSSGYENLGFGANINGIPSSTQNNPIDVEYVFPMDYNDNHISLSEFEISVPGVGFLGEDLERIDTVDGWGTLTLPNGTYNVLRVKSILHKVDTIYLAQPFPFGIVVPRPEEIEYKWLAAGTGIPVLKMISNAGVVAQIEYQDDFLVVTEVKEVNKINNVTVFPNPTKHHLVIDFKSAISGNLTINLKDVLGKNVGVIYQNFSPKGTNKLLINLAQHSIKPGIYFVELLVDDKAYYTEKIVVVE